MSALECGLACCHETAQLKAEEIILMSFLRELVLEGRLSGKEHSLLLTLSTHMVAGLQESVTEGQPRKT